VQYEHMLSEYTEYVTAAQVKLSQKSKAHAGNVDELKQQLSSLSVCHHVMRQCILSLTSTSTISAVIFNVFKKSFY